MKLIKPKAELLLQSGGIEGIYKQIELCGRTCYKSEQKYIDHADIVVTHECKNHCPFCVDKFINTSVAVVSTEAVKKFLSTIKPHAKPNTEVLLLGGEPTMASIANLNGITNIIREYGFSPIISTNNPNKDLIISLLPYFDWIQYTIRSWQDIKFFLPYKDKTNIKLAGDKRLTLEKLEEFIELTKDYPRKSVSMYFTPSHEELCTDPRIWSILDSLDWTKNGSYLYTFYKGVRIKRCIKGVTNLVEEPSVPKLYPNGNYNKTWANEDQDGYLDKSPSLNFVDRMIASKHLAMLEHGTVYLYLETNPENAFNNFEYPLTQYTANYNWSDVVGSIAARYRENKYSKVVSTITKDNKAIRRIYITSNFRVLVENNWLDDLMFLCPPTVFHEKRYTFRLITSIGVTRELNRHRVNSIAEQSTRYCNFSKDKFNNQVSFCLPSWMHISTVHPTMNNMLCLLSDQFDQDNADLRFLSQLAKAEHTYKLLLSKGWQPQQAREVLPLCTATEICHTAFASDWKHFFDLRLFGTTGKPHPDMLHLVQLMKEEAENACIWHEICPDDKLNVETS